MQNGDPIFELNDAILERIIFAMEDQTKSRVIDLRTGELVPRPEGELELHLAPPPDWAPADGFRLMENFCARVKNLELKRALMRSLSRGKGVFKAFRLVLADYPQEDVQFREYKNAVLKRHVESWMDDMRESLGLARMGPEPDEYEELIDEEFSLERRTLADSPYDLAALAEEVFVEALGWLPAAVATSRSASSWTSFPPTPRAASSTSSPTQGAGPSRRPPAPSRSRRAAPSASCASSTSRRISGTSGWSSASWTL
ncbi:hypothetical protein LWX53_03150 [bacterium]|nr:hypothetical protein [bacterium]